MRCLTLRVKVKCIPTKSNKIIFNQKNYIVPILKYELIKIK